MKILHGRRLVAVMGTMAACSAFLPSSANALTSLRLEAEGLSLAFQSLTLGNRNEVVEHKVIGDGGEEIVMKIPGRLLWDTLTLTRPLDGNQALWNWRAQVEKGDVESAKRHFSIVAYGELGDEVARWEFEDGWPAGLVSGIDASSTPIETLRLEYGRFARAQVSLPQNRPPVINLPASFQIAVGDTAQFSVSTSDPDNDLVTLINLVSPDGSVFEEGLFIWTVPLRAIATSEEITFQADDQQNADNSIVTKSLTITIPRDFDEDLLDDDWEIIWFDSLIYNGGDDVDDDGSSNLKEFRAATSPIDPESRFFVAAITSDPETVSITFTTQPGMQYLLQGNDNGPHGPEWITIGSPWTEEGTEASSHTVQDAAPAPGASIFYRILTRRP
jgi:phage tail-like protein